MIATKKILKKQSRASDNLLFSKFFVQKKASFTARGARSFKIYFDYWILEKALKENFIPELATLFYLQKQYVHRKIFISRKKGTEAELDRVSMETGVSKSSIKKCIKKFTNLGIIKKEPVKYGHVYVILGANKQRELFNIKKPGKVHYWDTAKVDGYTNLKVFLRSLPVLSNINLQAKYVKTVDNIGKKRETRLYKTCSAYRKRIDARFETLNVDQKTPTLSIESIACILGCCSKTAQTIKNFLVKNRFIKSFKREELIARCKDYYLALEAIKTHDFPSGVFAKRNGNIVKSLSCGIVLMHDRPLLDIVSNNYSINLVN